MRQQLSVNISKLLNSTTIALTAIVVLISLFSCGNEKKSVAPSVECSDSLAIMSTYGVSTLISDSGRISYRIDAEEWRIFHKRNPPYWAFEKGYPALNVDFSSATYDWDNMPKEIFSYSEKNEIDPIPFSG